MHPLQVRPPDTTPAHICVMHPAPWQIHPGAECLWNEDTAAWMNKGLICLVHAPELKYSWEGNRKWCCPGSLQMTRVLQAEPALLESWDRSQAQPQSTLKVKRRQQDFSTQKQWWCSGCHDWVWSTLPAASPSLRAQCYWLPLVYMEDQEDPALLIPRRHWHIDMAEILHCQAPCSVLGLRAQQWKITRHPWPQMDWNEAKQ